jgi:hypothetical protein
MSLGTECRDRLQGQFSGDEARRSPKNFAKALRFFDVFAWRSVQPV